MTGYPPYHVINLRVLSSLQFTVQCAGSVTWFTKVMGSIHTNHNLLLNRVNLQH